ncbi:MAG: N,N-dimethylformamidase beta subunit family domain-containing protein [Burkholderiales bacterium]
MIAAVVKIGYHRVARRLRAGALAVLAFLTLPAVAQNVIQIENAKTAGVTTEWQIPDANYASNQEIEGYASATSVNRGGSINLFVQTADPTYTVNIYRIGWYGGAGGRLVAGPLIGSGNPQPACQTTDPGTRLIECNWTTSVVLGIPNNAADPTDWASGVYLAKLTGGSSGKQSYIIFVVRDDARPAGAMFQTAVTTYAAYNNWGGYNFYDSDSVGQTPANKVSFNRPYKVSQRHLNGKGAGDFLSWEINMLRFVEREGVDVTYSTNIDTHAAPARLLNHRTFMSVGHDEYYTKEMYDAVQAARDARVNLAFFGANNIYWQIRLEPSSLTGQPNRTVVGYKYDTDPIVNIDPSLATYTWRETSRAPINRPEAALMGAMYDYNSLDGDMVIADCSSWICAGTNLQPGDVLPGMLGYEVDKIEPSSPPGTLAITSSPYYVCLNANCSVSERRFSNVTYYSTPSGAGVFATGSMQWNWGLDAYSPGPPGGGHDVHGDRTNAAVQRITRNVLDQFTSVGGRYPPHITSTPVTTAPIGTAYSYGVVATDANGDVLTYALTQRPAGMSINPTTGLITWTPTAAQTGFSTVTVRVDDGRGLFTGQTFTITVGIPNQPPEITSLPISTTTATAGAAYSYKVEAADPNDDSLTYALTAGPSGMSIDAATGLINWTPTTAQIGSQTATVRATDPGGLFAAQPFTITVVAANDPPQITSTPLTTATVGVTYSFKVHAIDENGDALNFALPQGPMGMSISLASGLIAWTPTPGQTGSHAVTVQVTDSGGLVATQAFTITVAVANSPPPNTAAPGGSTTPPAVASGGGSGGGGGGCAMRIDGEPDAFIAMLALLALFGAMRRRGASCTPRLPTRA